MQQETNVFSLLIFSVILFLNSFSSVLSMVTVTKEAKMFLKYILWGKLIKFKT